MDQPGAGTVGPGAVTQTVGLDLGSAPCVGHMAVGELLKHKEHFLQQAWEQYMLPGTDTVKPHTSVFKFYFLLFPGAVHAVISRSYNKYRPVSTTELVAGKVQIPLSISLVVLSQENTHFLSFKQPETAHLGDEKSNLKTMQVLFFRQIQKTHTHTHNSVLLLEDYLLNTALEHHIFLCQG